MRLYLDDDVVSVLLTQALKKARHDTLLPKDCGMVGKADALHLAYAIGEDRVLISRNYKDFEYLHVLVMACGGHHPGILLVRRDNDPRRNLGPADIVRALAKLQASGAAIADHCQPLNPWK